MIHTRCFYRLLGLACALFAIAFASSGHAQGPAPVTLSTELLDKMDAAVKNIGSDSAVKAEYAAAMKEAGDKMDKLGEIIDSKYPKLAEAYTSASISPLEFIGGGLTIMTCMLQEQTPSSSGDADANMTFYKANKERVAKTMSGVESLDKP